MGKAIKIDLATLLFLCLQKMPDDSVIRRIRGNGNQQDVGIEHYT